MLDMFFVTKNQYNVGEKYVYVYMCVCVCV